jgi:hypothetical protein
LDAVDAAVISPDISYDVAVTQCAIAYLDVHDLSYKLGANVRAFDALFTGEFVQFEVRDFGRCCEGDLLATVGTKETALVL